jgi:DNA recombination protein RmuC
MDLNVYAVIAVTVGILFVTFYFLTKQRKQFAQLRDNFSSLEEKINFQQTYMQEQSHQNYKDQVDLFTSQQLGYKDSVENLYLKLGALQNSAKQLIDLNTNLVAAQNFLYSPKLRGVHSERFLAELLFQILSPKSFALQYCFTDQTKVDAAIFCDHRILCIDAKFPLENFKKLHESSEEDSRVKKLFYNDVKKHIVSISAKYIKPQEKTFEYALMYCPAENIYYQLITEFEKDGFSFSQLCYENHVIAVSPSTLYVYLNTLQYAIRNATINDVATALFDQMDGLDKDIESLHSELTKCGGHFHHLMSSFQRLENISDTLGNRTRKIKNSENEFTRKEG